MTIALALVALYAASAAILFILAARAPLGRQDEEAGFVLIGSDQQLKPSGRMAAKPSYG